LFQGHVPKLYVPEVEEPVSVSVQAHMLTSLDIMTFAVNGVPVVLADDKSIDHARFDVYQREVKALGVDPEPPDELPLSASPQPLRPNATRASPAKRRHF
jgi:hypothetical protein